MKELMLSVRDVSVNYHNVLVMKNINMVAFRNEITGIIYENEMEKTVLIKLFRGEIKSYQGIYKYEGVIKKEAWVIGNESNLINTLSIEDHLFGFIKRYKNPQKTKRNSVKKILSRFHIKFDIYKTINDLTEFEKIELEILMGYMLQKKSIFLIDLSTKLSFDEMKTIWVIINEMRTTEKISFILMDYFENPMFYNVDLLYFMRNGTIFYCLEGKQIEKGKINSVLKVDIGNEIENGIENEEVMPQQIFSKEIIKINHISTQEFVDLNLDLHEGEIIKIIYHDRKKAEKFIEIFQDTKQIKEGKLFLEGKQIVLNSYFDALDHKIGFVPMNPTHTMLSMHLSVKMNLFYPLNRKIHKIFFTERYEKEIKKNFLKDIDPECYEQKVNSQTPITQMNIIYAKWFLFKPKLLICVNPFPNFNSEMNQLIKNWICRIAEHGTAVFVLVSNLPSNIQLPGNSINID